VLFDVAQMNIEGYWTTFKSHIFNAMDQYIPSKTLTSRWNIPWINQNIKKMIRKKERLISSKASTLCTRFSLVVRTRSKIFFSLVGSVTHCCKQSSSTKYIALIHLIYLHSQQSAKLLSFPLKLN
jgi:hypothetical protein